MASICDDPNGRRRIQFVAPDESRKTIRLGKIDRKGAESICRHVEALLAAKIGGQPVPRDTAAWLTGVGAALRDKLAAAGLVEPERRLTAGEFLADWLTAKRAGGYKPASLIAWGQTVKELADLFGARALTTLTHADGEAYRAAMQGRSLRMTTINKRLIHARQMLERRAVRAHPQIPGHVRGASDPRAAGCIPVADVHRVIEPARTCGGLLVARPSSAGCGRQ